MAGMNDGDGEPVPPGQRQQLRLYRRLLDAIVAERALHRFLRHRNLDRRAMCPDRAGMEKMPDPAAQALCQQPGAVGLERDHVDHDVGPDRLHLGDEAAVGFGGGAVDNDPLDRRPAIVLEIRGLVAPAHRRHVEARLDQARHEIGPDVTRRADDKYLLGHDSAPLRPHAGTSNSIPARCWHRPGEGPNKSSTTVSLR
jgi:hypothetical protein